MAFDKTSVEKLNKILNSDKIEPYIRKIVFTNFKNIEKNQEITFDYPITAFVGPNGTNKTSALVALFGSVASKTPAEYWFTTPLDAAKSDSKKDEPYQSYYYTYKDNKNIAEVLQINNQRSDRNVDYWETDKPKKNLGMNIDIDDIVSVNKSKTRWKKIQKDIVYINFRSELSSFDRCLYHANKPSKKFNSKQDYIRDKSKYLKDAISSGAQSYKLYSKERVISNRTLTQVEVDYVSSILNKNYTEIRYIEHRFFDVIGGTAYIKINDLNYSEAYAGSGEYAVISLVNKVISASQNSLILLDEPEVSLHPQAQKNLIDFLNRQVLKYKHQVVISTHSPEIVECLPDCAVKLFMENPVTNAVIINNSASKLNVFHTIGKVFEKIPVYVEDRLAKAVIDKAIKYDADLKNSFEVVYIPGGSNSLSLLLSALSEANHTQLILFDGDQECEYYRNNNKFPDSEDITDKKLQGTISALGFTMSKFKDSNSDSYEQYRRFLNSINNYVTYLPFDSPEYFLLKENNECTKWLSNNDAKEKIKEMTASIFGDDHTDNERIFSMQLQLLNRIDIDSISFEKIRYLLAFYLKNHTLKGWLIEYDGLFGV